MKTLLCIMSSARKNRSISRLLADRFVNNWRIIHPDGKVIIRDVGCEPPSAISEAWIEAAFTPEKEHTETNKQILIKSNLFLQEIYDADEIVIATPMYNFGMPSQLKAYFDQIIRIGKSFEIIQDNENPYKGLIMDKQTTIIIVAGNGDLLRGGVLEFLDFLEPHIQALLNFIGITSLKFIRVGYAESKDDRFVESLELANSEIDSFFEQNNISINK